MAEAAAVEMEDVSFSYDNAPVVEDATFRVPEREFAAIVGPNGGGKTTLLKLMMGLLRPDRGKVRLFGRLPHEVVRRVGYVAQGFQYDSRLPISLRDVVQMARLGGDCPPSREVVTESLDCVGMQRLAGRHFADVSAGQQQRVLIARALATEPDILMLDEPTASLDAAAEREIYALLKRLNEQMTIVVVTHDLGFVSHVVNSVLCVDRRVRRHPTAEMHEVTGEVLEELYGKDLRLVRHDHEYGEDRQA